MAANEKEFNSIIVTDKEGAKFTLQFNANTVKRMERNGFKIDTDYPNTMIEELFMGAFQMHHKGIPSERVKTIWLAQSKKDELLAMLIKLYMKPLEDLMAEPEKPEGVEETTPTWTTA